MTARGNDPHLKAAREAVADFKAGAKTAADALKAIWDAMALATKSGHDTDPYVKLTDAVTFPDERHDVDPDKERAAAEWMAELAGRESEDD